MSVAVFMQTRKIAFAGGIGLQQLANRRVFIYLFVGCQPTMAIGGHDDVVHAIVVYLWQATDRVIFLVEKVGTMKTANEDMALRNFGQARDVIALQKVGMGGIAAKHQYLPAIVTTHTAALGGIPQVALGILNHL